MVTKSQDHSLAVYPRAEFEKLARRASQASRSNPEARAFLRNLAAATDEQHPDTQGRITLSADHRRYANLSKECVVIGSVDYLEIWDSPGMAGRISRPTKRTSPRPPMKLCTTSSDLGQLEPGTSPVHRGLCPNRPWRTSPTPGPRSRAGTSVQGRSIHSEDLRWLGEAGDHGHVPVLLDRCVELLTPALTRRSPDGTRRRLVDATLGAGGHAERFLTELPGLRADRTGSRPRRPVDRRRAAGAVRRPGPAGPHPLRRHRRRARRNRLLGKRPTCRRRPVRPRGLVDATRPRRARVLLLRRCAAGHADGSRRGADRGRGPQHLRREGADPRAARVRRGAVRRAGSPPDRPPPRPPTVHHHRRTGGAALSRRSRRPPAAPAGIRPSAPSRRCASPSTASWTRCATRCPRRWARWTPAAASW